MLKSPSYQLSSYIVYLIQYLKILKQRQLFSAIIKADDNRQVLFRSLPDLQLLRGTVEIQVKPTLAPLRFVWFITEKIATRRYKNILDHLGDGRILHRYNSLKKFLVKYLK